MTTFAYMSPLETKPDEAVEVHGYALRVIRQARGRTAKDLADALGCNRTYITHLEVGSKRRVSPVFYNRLIDELQIADFRALLATAPLREDVA